MYFRLLAICLFITNYIQADMHGQLAQLNRKLYSLLQALQSLPSEPFMMQMNVSESIDYTMPTGYSPTNSIIKFNNDHNNIRKIKDDSLKEFMHQIYSNFDTVFKKITVFEDAFKEFLSSINLPQNTILKSKPRYCEDLARAFNELIDQGRLHSLKRILLDTDNYIKATELTKDDSRIALEILTNISEIIDQFATQILSYDETIQEKKLNNIQWQTQSPSNPRKIVTLYDWWENTIANVLKREVLNRQHSIDNKVQPGFYLNSSYIYNVIEELKKTADGSPVEYQPIFQPTPVRPTPASQIFQSSLQDDYLSNIENPNLKTIAQDISGYANKIRDNLPKFQKLLEKFINKLTKYNSSERINEPESFVKLVTLFNTMFGKAVISDIKNLINDLLSYHNQITPADKKAARKSLEQLSLILNQMYEMIDEFDDKNFNTLSKYRWKGNKLNALFSARNEAAGGTWFRQFILYPLRENAQKNSESWQYGQLNANIIYNAIEAFNK